MTGSSGTNTSTTTSGPPPQVLQNYGQLVSAAESQANQPLNLYSGPMVAGFTPDQQAGFSGIESAQGLQVPYINAAAGEYGAATTPLWPSLPQFDSSYLPAVGQMGLGNAQTGASQAGQVAGGIVGSTTPYQAMGTNYNVGNYLSPYTKNVTDALQNLFNQQNATQLQQVRGNATAQGAYGGDREAVAEALTAQQQQLAEAPTLANVLQSGYQQAQQESNTQQGLGLQAGQLGLGANTAALQGFLGTGQLGLGTGQAGFGEFNQQQQAQLAAQQASDWLASQAGFGLSSLGNQAQSGALTGAGALLQSGGLQQALAQEQMNVPFQQFQATQAYPYQTLGFLSPIIEGTGSLSGGTGTTTTPGPSAFSQIAGAGLTGLGAFGLANQAGLFGGGASAFPNLTADAISNTANSSIDAFNAASFPTARGGRVRKQIGGGAGTFSPMSGIGTVQAPGATPGIGGPTPSMNGGTSLSLPTVPGIDDGIPNFDLSSMIPQQSPGATPSSKGLSVNQPVVTQTQTSSGGGGGGILSAVGPLLTVAKLAMSFAAAKDGGRIHFDDGGMVIPGQIGSYSTDAQAQQQQKKGIGLPVIPQYSLDQIIHPGPQVVKGAGPPHGPTPQPPSQSGGIGDAASLLGQMKTVKGLLPNDSGTSTGSAIGGRIGFADGGAGPSAAVPASIMAQYGGAPPGVQNQMQQLIQLPLERLQEMAVQYPPSTQTGQMIQNAIRQKQSVPGSGTAPTSPQGSGQQQPQMGIGMPQPQQSGGTSQPAMGQPTGGTAYAEGGAANGGFVMPDELDPVPVVDHSGDTVKIRFPSEGKVLDLGLPPVRRAAGGRVHAAGGGSQYQGEIQAGNGVHIPLLNQDNGFLTIGNLQTDRYTGDPYKPGGGAGNWFQPLDQYRPPGTTINNGVITFPSNAAFTPGMAPIAQNFGFQNLPQSFTGIAPGGQTGGGGNSSSTPGPAPLTTDQQLNAVLLGFNPASLTPQQLQSVNAAIGPQQTQAFSTPGDSGGGGKRGGRIGFDEGGDTGTTDMAPTTDDSGSEAWVPAEKHTLGEQVAKDYHAAVDQPTPTPPEKDVNAVLSDTGGFDQGPRRGKIGAPSVTSPEQPKPNVYGDVNPMQGQMRGIGAPTAEEPKGFVPKPKPVRTVEGAPVVGDVQPPPAPTKAIGQPQQPVDPVTGNPIPQPPPAAKVPPAAITPPAAPEAPAAPAAAAPTAPINIPPMTLPPSTPAPATRAPPITGIGLPAPGPPGFNKTEYGPGAKGVVYRNGRLEDIETGKPVVLPDAAPAAAPAQPAPTKAIGQPVDPVTGTPLPSTSAPAATGGPDTVVKPGSATQYPPGHPANPDSPGPTNVRKAIKALNDSGASPAFIQAALNQPFYEGGWTTNWQPGDLDKGGSYGHLQFNYQAGSEGPQYDAWLRQNRGDLDPHDSYLQFKFLASRVPAEILHGGDPKAITDYLNTHFENYQGAAPGQRYAHLDDAAKLMAGDYSAIERTGGTDIGTGRGHVPPGGGTPVVSDNPSGMRGIGMDVGQGRGIGMRNQDDEAADHHGRHPFSLSDYAMPLLIAGLSTLGSRSPNALSEGFKAAAPYFTAQERTQAALENADVRRNAAAQVAESRFGTQQVALQAIQQRADDSLRRANEAKARLDEAAAWHQDTTALKAQAQQLADQARMAQIELNLYKVRQGDYAPPRHGHQNPSDPNSPEGEWYLPKVPTNEPNGGAVFVPGVGTAKAPTGQQAIYQSLIDSGAAKDMPEAIRVEAELKRDPNSQKNQAAIANLIGRQYLAGKQQQMISGDSDEKIEADAKARVLGWLSAAAPPAQTGTVTPGLTGQAGAAPAAPAAAQPAQPAPIKWPTWVAPGSEAGIDTRTNQPVFMKPDGKWYHADGSPYTAQ